MGKTENNRIFAGAVLYTASSLIPAIKADAWWVRVWDFPRLQMAFVGASLFALSFRSLQGTPLKKRYTLALVAAGLALDTYRIFPYSRFAKLESLPAQKTDKANQISLLTSNVLQFNTKREPLKELIRSKSPDIIFLLEVDTAWTDDMEHLKVDYPYCIINPLGNTYGLAFYSRLPLKESRVNFLIDDEVPSIEVILTLPSGQDIKVYGLHPKPPRPGDGPSTNRDAELIQIAKKSKDTDLPVVVIGDLNDVAWSHTTRHFRRISGLLDPRIGRGPVPTFPVRPPFLRFPIDHIFHSKSLRIMEMSRLTDIGSDHFPLFARLSYEPENKKEQKAPQPQAGDLKEAEETVKKALTNEN